MACDAVTRIAQAVEPPPAVVLVIVNARIGVQGTAFVPESFVDAAISTRSASFAHRRAHLPVAAVQAVAVQLFLFVSAAVGVTAAATKCIRAYQWRGAKGRRRYKRSTCLAHHRSDLACSSSWVSSHGVHVRRRRGGG